MPLPFPQGSILSLEEEEHHHLARVMRLRQGEEVELVNGRGSLAKANILAICKDRTSLKILSSSQEERPTRQIIAATPWMRPSKLEWVLEKGTELGADAFWLYPAEKSEAGEPSKTSLERLRKVTIAALKQSGRLFLPSIEVVSSLENVLERECSQILYGTLDSQAPWMQTEPKTKTLLFVTGPEKGFSAKELTLLNKKGRGVKLSQNILRAETAMIAALSLWGASGD